MMMMSSQYLLGRSSDLTHLLGMLYHVFAKALLLVYLGFI